MIKYIKYKNYTIEYVNDKKGINSYVKSITTKGRNYTAQLQSLWTFDIFYSHVHHLYDFEVYQKVVKEMIFELCELAINTKKINGALYCHVCSHIFNAISNYPYYLMKFQLHYNAMLFWKFILEILKLWDKEKPNKEIHKGTIYGYIGEVHMNIGDTEIAFANLYRAVRDDFKIEKYIPNYARQAPGYKILTLHANTTHWMSNYVEKIRSILSEDIAEFVKVFPQYSSFDIKNFDSLFIENKFFDKNKYFQDLKIACSYYIWQTYYYGGKIDRSEKSSTFDNLNSIPKLFGMCVAIESLASKLLGKEKYLWERMDLLYTNIGGTYNFKNDLYPEVNNKDEKIQSLLKQLLNYKSHKFAGKSINEIDRCILVYSLIRNFTAHNLKSIKIIGDKFFEIAQSFLFLIFVFLIELKKKKKI